MVSPFRVRCLMVPPTALHQPLSREMLLGTARRFTALGHGSREQVPLLHAEDAFPLLAEDQLFAQPASIRLHQQRSIQGLSEESLDPLCADPSEGCSRQILQI
jgi:hypothetical protein